MGLVCKLQIRQSTPKGKLKIEAALADGFVKAIMGIVPVPQWEAG